MRRRCFAVRRGGFTTSPLPLLACPEPPRHRCPMDDATRYRLTTWRKRIERRGWVSLRRSRPPWTAWSITPPCSSSTSTATVAAPRWTTSVHAGDRRRARHARPVNPCRPATMKRLTCLVYLARQGKNEGAATPRLSSLLSLASHPDLRATLRASPHNHCLWTG